MNEPMDSNFSRRKYDTGDLLHEVERVKNLVDTGFFGGLSYEQMGKLHKELWLIKSTIQTYISDTLGGLYPEVGEISSQPDYPEEHAPAYIGEETSNLLMQKVATSCDMDRMSLKQFFHYKKRRLVIRACRMASGFEVDTLEGRMKGNKGDWLVIGTKGELYPVANDIFIELYLPEICPGPCETP